MIGKCKIVLLQACLSSCFVLASQTEDPASDIQTALVLNQTGAKNEAMQIWEKVIETHAKDEWILTVFSEVMIREHFMDQAVQVYIHIRKRIGQPELFSRQLAVLYEAKQEYQNAIREWIVFLKSNPLQVFTVEAYLSRYPATEQTRNSIVQILRESAELKWKTPETVNFLIRLAVRFGLYSEALETVEHLERKAPEKLQGDFLFLFAQNALLKGAVKPAKQAFEQILKNFLQFKQKDAVLYNLAQIDGQLKMYKEAMDRLNQLISDCSKSALVPKALYEKGLLERDQLFLPQQAAETFNRLIERAPHAPEVQEAPVDLATCHVLSDDLERAEMVYHKALSGGFPYVKNSNVRIHLGLAEIDYFRGRFDQAKARLDSVFQNFLLAEAAAEPAINDGLTLSLLLKAYGKQDTESLFFLAKGELLTKQRRNHDALQMYNQILSLKKSADPMVAETLFRKGKLLLDMNQYSESAACLDTLLSRFPGYVYSEQAMERLGWAEEKMGNTRKALKMYVGFLEKYPRSVYANEIRKRIRQIEAKS